MIPMINKIYLWKIKEGMVTNATVISCATSFLLINMKSIFISILLNIKMYPL